MLRLRFAALSMTRGSSKLALVMLSVAKHPYLGPVRNISHNVVFDRQRLRL